MDEIDQQILDILRTNARAAVSDIARQVGLTNAPVARRISRLESAGIIKGYVAVIDEAAAGGIEAFTEIRLVGSVDTREIEEIVRQVPEVQQFFTISGDPDALLRFKVRNVEHLQTVVNAIRSTGLVSGTKSLIVMSTWDRSASRLTRE